MRQEDTILKHLREVGDISGMEALYMYRVRDLPKRISVLRAEGHAIRSERRTDREGGRYHRYFAA